MKELILKVNERPEKLHTAFQTIFIYTLNTQLQQAKMSVTSVSPYTIMKGKVILNCTSPYDAIRAEQLVNNAVRVINLFSSENNDFTFATDDELKLLSDFFNQRTGDKQKLNYLKAIKTLRKEGVYPSLSLQKSLLQEAVTTMQSKDVSNIENSSVNEIKQGDLQINSWLWTRVVNAQPTNPLRRETVLVTTHLSELGIKGIEELTLMTTNFFKHVMFIGTQELCRLAIQEEVNNSANIKNIFTKRIEIYENQYDKYLTACCSALLTRNLLSVYQIYEMLSNPNNPVPYEMRFPDLNELHNACDRTASHTIMEERWIKIILSNIDVVENIMTALNNHVERLLPLWRGSTVKVDYPANFDVLQMQYENMGLDIDTLDTLLSIDVEEGNVKKMLTTIKKAGVHSQYDKLPYDIAVQALKKKQISLSEKQMAIIEKRYNSIMKTVEMSKNIDADECIKIATELLNQFGDKLNKTVEQIAQNTLRYRICSERQLEVLRLALVELSTEKDKQTQASLPAAGITVGTTGAMSAAMSAGLMFNLPSEPPTKAVNVMEDSANKELVQETKKKLTADAYKSAFGDDDEPEETDTDSIWTD